MEGEILEHKFSSILFLSLNLNQFHREKKNHELVVWYTRLITITFLSFFLPKGKSSIQNTQLSTWFNFVDIFNDCYGGLRAFKKAFKRGKKVLKLF